MENSASKTLLCFLAEEEKLADQRLRMLNNLLEPTPSSTFPSHITETLNLLRQNAEEDLSNILHIQSIFPSGLGKKSNNNPIRQSKPKHNPVSAVHSVISETTAVLGEVEDGIEAGIAVTDDLFLMEGVGSNSSQLRSPQSVVSDEDRDDSELDEGIHIPSKFGKKKSYEVAASLPVGIPWPAHMTSTTAVAPAKEVVLQDVREDRPKDIAASIQAMAKSVHTSSIFGDNTFGDLPRPRLNTLSKD